MNDGSTRGHFHEKSSRGAHPTHDSLGGTHACTWWNPWWNPLWVTQRISMLSEEQQTRIGVDIRILSILHGFAPLFL